MLILQQLFNLSDEELEFQVNDRRSFEEFVGLGVMNYIPYATTIAFFIEWLRKAGVIEELFEIFEAYLRSRGLLGGPGPRVGFCLHYSPILPSPCWTNTSLQSGMLSARTGCGASIAALVTP